LRVLGALEIGSTQRQKVMYATAYKFMQPHRRSSQIMLAAATTTARRLMNHPVVILAVCSHHTLLMHVADFSVLKARNAQSSD
jgi:hypothetical protein